jgi:hypothetical protein
MCLFIYLPYASVIFLFIKMTEMTPVQKLQVTVTGEISLIDLLDRIYPYK